MKYDNVTIYPILFVSYVSKIQKSINSTFGRPCKPIVIFMELPLGANFTPVKAIDSWQKKQGAHDTLHLYQSTQDPPCSDTFIALPKRA